MQLTNWRTGLIVSTLFWSASVIAVPETINIQGNLERDGDPLVGNRAFELQFYDSPTDGNALGGVINGFLTVSPSGRYSIEVTPPAEVFSATDVYYQLGVDSANPTDGTIDSVDLFPDRVKVNSVLYVETVIRQGSGSGLDADLLDGVDSTGFADAAHSHNLQDLAGAVIDNQVPDGITIDHAASVDTATTAEHAATADQVDTATIAKRLVGPLSNPGDQIVLGNGVFLQVAPDGVLELVAGDARMRLAQQKWFDPANLLDNISPDGQDAAGPQVALNTGGEAVIVWHQSDEANTQIYRSENRNGSWDDPSGLSDNISPNGQPATSAQVALNSSGEALIAWFQSDGSRFQIFRSEFRNGSWSDPTGLTDNISPDGQFAFLPQVALNAGGEAVIVWAQSDGARQQIFRSEYRNGVWSDPAGLTDNISPDGQGAFNPQVAMNAGGDAVIVWQQSDGASPQIFRSEYRNGSWSDLSGLSDNISPNGEAAFIPQVALSDNGDAVIVWEQSDGAQKQIFRSEYRNGSWTDPSSLNDNISPGGQAAIFAQVAVNAGGEAVIVWQQSDGVNQQIFRSEYRDGSWTDPSSLSDNISPNGSAATNPQAALNANGDAVIVWLQFDGTNVQVFRSEFLFGF